MVRYLTIEQILLIHSMVIDETGGSHGILNQHALLSVIAAPAQEVFGQELYPTIFLKASVYARDIVTNHPFMDGNKRTGMVSASVFLENNGHVIDSKEGEIEKMALKIIVEKFKLEDIADWFIKHSKKLK